MKDFLDRDTREPRNLWAPGFNAIVCKTCGELYLGDEDSTICASCAFRDKDVPDPRDNKDEAALFFDSKGLPAFKCKDDHLDKREERLWEQKYFGFKCSDIPLKMDKPPLGLVPRCIVNKDRIEKIKEAMLRFIKVKKEIPLEWIEEYNDLCREK